MSVVFSLGLGNSVLMVIFIQQFKKKKKKKIREEEKKQQQNDEKMRQKSINQEPIVVNYHQVHFEAKRKEQGKKSTTK